MKGVSDYHAFQEFHKGDGEVDPMQWGIGEVIKRLFAVFASIPLSVSILAKTDNHPALAMGAT